MIIPKRNKTRAPNTFSRVLLNRDIVSSLITYTQSGGLTYFNSSGVLQTAAVDTMVLDYNPSTLALRGYPFWEARTNSIRNNTMQGAVAGTPGTIPTNWSIGGLGTLTQQIVGTGTSNGIDYIDIRFSGTTSTTVLNIRFDGSNTIAAANGQTWAQSVWSAVVAGSTSNVSQVGIGANLFDAGAAYVSDISYTGFVINTSATLTRTTATGTIAAASAAFVRPYAYLTFSSGVAVDITLRIGLPQLELGAFATPVIKTTSSAVTRAAPSCAVTGTNFSSIWNATEGTMVMQGSVAAMPSGTFPRLFAACGANVDTDEISFYRRTSDGYFAGVTTVSSVGSGEVFLGTLAANTAFKAAHAFKANDSQGAFNGTATSTDTSVTLPTCTSFRIMGAVRYQPAPSGWVSSLSYYSARLPSAALQALTA